MFSKGKGLVGVIDRGCKIEGNINFSGHMRLNSVFKGNIVGDGQLFVGRGGDVDAKIEVDELIVEGLVKGSVLARDCVEIHKGGEVQADVKTGGMTIESGGIFRGQCSMDVAETVDIAADSKSSVKAKKLGIA